MDGQMTILDYQNSISYTRTGKQRTTPDWVRQDRCNNCSYWLIDIVEDQPPEGWGVTGICQCLREGQVGYHHTDQWSWCQEWRNKTEGL